MKQSELIELMHAVLDGEATAAQKRELDQRLTSDPAARTEFDALRAIFAELEAMPSAHPPEGLVASVMADLPAHQLSRPSRVIGATGDASSNANTLRRTYRSWPFFPGSESMSEQSRFKRKGLWIGVDFDPKRISARAVCERLMAKGVLSKDTHDTVVRLAPPLVIARADLDWALDRFEEVIHEVAHAPHPVAA